MSKCRNNNYNRGGRYAAKSNTGTWIKVIAVLLAMLAIAYVIASLVVGAWNPLKWNETRLARTNGITQGDGNDGSFPDGEGLTNGYGILNETGRNGMETSKEIIAYSDYALYSVSEEADTAYLLNVTVKPDTAFDKRLRGAVGWQDADSEWAQGKNVADYAAITQSESDGCQFVLTILKPFGEPITATVFSVNDVDVKCTCRLDYLKTLDIDNTVFEINPELKAAGDNHRTYAGTKNNTVEITPAYTVGTVAGSITLTRIMFTPASPTCQAIQTALDAAGVSSRVCGVTGAIFAKLTGGTSFTVPVERFIDYDTSISSEELQRYISITNNVLYEKGQSEITYQCAYTKVLFRVDYTYGEDYGVTLQQTVDKGTYMFNVSGLTHISSVSSITPDKNNIVVIPG